MIRKKTICEFCSKEYAINMIERHRVPCQRKKLNSYKESTPIDSISTRVSDDKYVCNACCKTYSRKGIGTHYWLKHGDGIPHLERIHAQTRKMHELNRGRSSWNAGLTAKTDPRIAKSAELVRKKYESGVLTPTFAGKKHTEESKKKISASQSLAHKEGRAWNIGQSRWNNKPSYPEQYFIQVIENEFLDKMYEREFSLGRFSLDFAWPHKKKCIEIDGKQHDELPDVRERDLRKNDFIEISGWKVLRIKWKDMYSTPQAWIKIAKDFIG